MPTLPELLGHFESLGDNCELGIVQRFAGIEPLGFFRLNFAKLPALLRALDRDFAGIEDVELYVDSTGEYFVRAREYGFAYHSGRFAGTIAPETLLAEQRVAVRFLVRKLREDLRAAEKIFVRKGEDSGAREDIDALRRSLARHGNVTLLWVVREDPGHRAGSVEVLEDGLLKAYLDRFARLDDVQQFSPIWYDVCRNAYALWHAGCRTGTIVSAGEPPPSNLVYRADRFDGHGWRIGEAAICAAAAAVPPPFPGGLVMRHILREDAGRRGEAAASTRSGAAKENIHFHYVPGGLIAGEMYVGSIHVWVPAEFTGELVGCVFDGFASVAKENADLRRRGTWQRVWVASTIPQGMGAANLALMLRGPAGSRVFSSCWQLERGAKPGRYVPPAPQRGMVTPAS